MDERTDRDPIDEAEPELDPNASMSGVGGPTDRKAIEGLGYTGEDDTEPVSPDNIEPDESAGPGDRPTG